MFLLQYIPFRRWFYSGDQFGSELWKDGQPAATKSESGKGVYLPKHLARTQQHWRTQILPLQQKYSMRSSWEGHARPLVASLCLTSFWNWLHTSAKSAMMTIFLTSLLCFSSVCVSGIVFAQLMGGRDVAKKVLFYFVLFHRWNAFLNNRHCFTCSREEGALCSA